MKYRTILADPPWSFTCWSRAGEGRTASHHYRVQDTTAICALPVRDLRDTDCTLLLWAVWTHLPDALEVMLAWGFRYKTGLPWLKMTAAAAPRIGLGYHFRSCSELLLVGTRGSPGVPEPEDRLPGVMFCPINEHSQKPDYQYEIAEKYPPPWLELFARPRDGLFGPRPGWTQIGDACDGMDIGDALRELAQRKAVLQ